MSSIEHTYAAAYRPALHRPDARSGSRKAQLARSSERRTYRSCCIWQVRGNEREGEDKIIEIIGIKIKIL
jgi:hypothetical protein